LTVNGTVTFGKPSVVPTDTETSAQGDGSTGYLSGGPFAKMPSTAPQATILMAMRPVPTSAQATAAVLLSSNAAQGTRGDVVAAGFQATLSGVVGGVTAGSLDGENHLIGYCFPTNPGDTESNPFVVVDGTRGVGVSGGVVAALNQNAQLLQGVLGYTNFPIGRVAIFAGVLTPKDWVLLMQAFTGVS
jgi:hypothetical protein